MPGFDAAEIDETIHGRLRLGIMAYLSTVSPATFTELAQVLEATNGNLSVHLRKLEDAHYVEIDKGFIGRRPVTHVRITGKGARAWAIYLDALKPLFSSD